MTNNHITINKEAIVSKLNQNQTQIILQRHCDYDRKNGGLIFDSAKEQTNIANTFLDSMIEELNQEEIKNTYFLFVASETISKGDFKRCVATTDIVMNLVKDFLVNNNISTDHIINLNNQANYQNKIHEDKHLVEPTMFIDNTGYFEFLKNKYNGINIDFWIAYESDLHKDIREGLNAEGPDEIVNRGIFFLKSLERYANYFHLKYPHKKLIIWCGTHYDLISPLVKQTILFWDKSDTVLVDYCGGISLTINEANEITAHINNSSYPFALLENEQHLRHF